MLLAWFKRLRKVRLIMGKPNRQQGKRKGNSPYKKYKKQPFFYGEGYKDNYLHNGVLYRNGKPHRFTEPAKTTLMAAE